MPVRAVFFDFGGVIMRTEYQSPRQHLAERFGMDYDDIDKVVFASESARRASVGAIPEHAHWAEVLKRLKHPISEMKSFQDEFFGGDVIDRVVGLEVGADEYIAKPFHLREVHRCVRHCHHFGGGWRNQARGKDISSCVGAGQS